MLLSTAYNRIETVLSNLHHSFNEIAQKTHHYIRSLPSAKQPPDKLIISKSSHIRFSDPGQVSGLAIVSQARNILERDKIQKGRSPSYQNAKIYHGLDHKMRYEEANLTAPKLGLIGQQKCKTYSRWYSHVVTHRSTNYPVRSLSTGERTGSSVLCDLWPYVERVDLANIINAGYVYAKAIR